jgi:hypothetical protein
MTKTLHASSSSSSSHLQPLSNKLVLVNEERKKTSLLLKNLKSLFNLNFFQQFSTQDTTSSPRSSSSSSKHHNHYQSYQRTSFEFVKNSLQQKLSHNNNNIAISIDLSTYHKLNPNHSPKLSFNLNQEKYINFLNYYYQINYHQNIIYYNNLLLALIILFVLFSLLVLLEENDTFYNLSAITFLLLITFNLIILIFSHNLTKQFLIHKHFLN